MSEPSPSPRSGSPAVILVAVVAAVVILVVGIVVGAYLRGTSASDQGTTIPSDSMSGQVAPAPGASKDTVGVSDPDVTKWHDALFGPISSVFGTLTGEMPATEQEMVRVCESLTLSVGDLDKAPPAPKADLEEAYRSWVASLDDALAGCATSPGAAGPDAWVSSINDRLSATSDKFDQFGRVLDLYYDFSAPPPVQ